MKKKKLVLLSSALIATMAIGGISAYFTDADTATNEFVVGKVSLDLQEPNWDPEDATEIVPNEEIQKDPQILNDGENDEFVFLEVKVPYANVVTANADGTKNVAADTELFSYTVASGWTELGTASKDEENGVITHLYVYGSDSACTILVKDTTTPALFESVTFANIVEDQGLEGTDLDIVINAYGIQASNIDDGKTAPTDVWDVISNQTPTTTVTTTEDEKTDIKTTNTQNSEES